MESVYFCRTHILGTIPKCDTFHFERTGVMTTCYSENPIALEFILFIKENERTGTGIMTGKNQIRGKLTFWTVLEGFTFIVDDEWKSVTLSFGCVSEWNQHEADLATILVSENFNLPKNRFLYFWFRDSL